jgi:hypothetical protein
MLRVLLSAVLVGLAYAKDCQYFAYQEGYWYVPLGIDRCNYMVENGVSSSFQIVCKSSTMVEVQWFSTVHNCVGSRTYSYFDKNNATFNCDSTAENCGKIFGAKTPCTCTTDDGTCDLAYGYSVVDDLCLKDWGSSSTTSTKYAITCGSTSKAKASIQSYATTDCSGVSVSLTYKAGCQSSSYYEAAFNSSAVDWVVCPANAFAPSLLLVSLLALFFSY